MINERQEVTLIGVLQESPAIGPKKTSLIMAVEAMVTPTKRTTATGKVLLRLPGLPPEDLWPGDRFSARGVLSRPRNYATPASFNYRDYLANQSIHLTGWIRSPAHILKIESLSEPTLVHRLRYGPERIRHTINRFLERTLPDRQSSLYRAILTGDRSGVPPELSENFKKTGSIHLLAISGLHMGLLALFVTTFLHWLLKRSTWILLHMPAWKISLFLALPPLVLYALIAGFHTPVVRSLIMTSVFIAAILLDRQWHVPTNIALAALLILIFNPASLFTVSFQLSFAAVIGICTLIPLIRKKFQQAGPQNSLGEKLKNWLSAGLLASLAAMVATSPLLLFYFNRFSPISPLSTLLIEPFLCIWSLGIGLLGSCFIFISPEIAAGLFHIGAWGLVSADKITGWLAEIPFCCLWFSTPTWFEVICFYLVLAGLLYQKKFPPLKLIAPVALVTLIAFPLAIKTARKMSEVTTVTFLDIGQGNATLIEFPHGHVVLLDGGGTRSEKFNVGEAVIAPYLWKKRIRRINDVVISHPDMDHCNGLPFILTQFKPGNVWINGQPGGEFYNNLIRQAKEQSLTVKIPRPDTIIRRTAEAVLTNIAGLHLAEREKNLSGNDKSLVLKLTTPSLSFLFPGDIEEPAEKIITANNRNLAADILLAPHHGSRSSSSQEFLHNVQPEEVIISAGSFKPDLFPAQQSLNRYKENGYTILITAQDGTVSYRVNGKKWERMIFRDFDRCWSN